LGEIKFSWFDISVDCHAGASPSTAAAISSGDNKPPASDIVYCFPSSLNMGSTLRIELITTPPSAILLKYLFNILSSIHPQDIYTRLYVVTLESFPAAANVLNHCNGYLTALPFS
jgi:hypothetical protein